MQLSQLHININIFTSFLPEIIDEVMENMNKQRTLIIEGKVLDEIGGLAGLHKVITRVLQRFQQIYTTHKVL